MSVSDIEISDSADYNVIVAANFDGEGNGDEGGDEKDEDDENDDDGGGIDDRRKKRGFGCVPKWSLFRAKRMRRKFSRKSSGEFPRRNGRGKSFSFSANNSVGIVVGAPGGRFPGKSVGNGGGRAGGGSGGGGSDRTCCCFCMSRPRTSELPEESHEGDPNDPSFTNEMLRDLLQRNDFYSRECNTHLDLDIPCCDHG